MMKISHFVGEKRKSVPLHTVQGYDKVKVKVKEGI